MKHSHRRRSTEEWSEIILQAYLSNTSLRQWCIEHQIRFDTFCNARRRLLRYGELDFLRERIYLPDGKNENAYVDFPLKNRPAFLALNPIRSNLSVESMAALIWFELGIPLKPGQVFFFISNNRKQIYALRICENGYCLLTRKLEKGCFTWPGREADGTCSLYRWEYEKIASTLEI